MNAASAAIIPRHSLRFRGRSFMALVLAPEAPLHGWMAELDEWAKKSAGFFLGKSVILDVSALPHDKDSLAQLITDLFERNIRILGVEGTKGSWLGLGMPPLISGGKDSHVQDLAEMPAAAKVATAVAAPAPAPQAASTLLHDSPVRSGQSIIFPEGDVTIVGSVASGAEVVAGGSLHIYGTLRGRAIAGSMGNGRARIFCNKLEAELLAIDGLYRTADEMSSEFRGRPVQVWLEDDAMKMAALN